MKQDTAATELRRRRFSTRGQHYHRNSQSSWTFITQSVFYSFWLARHNLASGALAAAGRT
jgi:hypothetical protein